MVETNNAMDLECHLSRCRRGKPLTWSRLSRLEERFRLPAGRVVHMWFPETAQSSVGAGFGNVKHNAVGIPYVATRIKRGVPDCRDGMSISFLLFFPGTHGPSLRSVGWRRFATSNLLDRLGDGSANVRVVVSGGFEIGEVFPSTGPIASQDPGRSGTIRGIVLLETRCARLKLFLEPGDRARAQARTWASGSPSASSRAGRQTSSGATRMWDRAEIALNRMLRSGFFRPAARSLIVLASQLVNALSRINSLTFVLSILESYHGDFGKHGLRNGAEGRKAVRRSRLHFIAARHP